MLSQRLPPESLTGAPLQALQLSRALVDSGASVRFFTTQRGRAPAPQTGNTDLPVTALRFAGSGGLAATMRTLRGALATRSINRADIVHAHALSPMVIGYALMRGIKDPPLLVKPSLGGQHEEGEVQRLRHALPPGMIRRALARISAFAVLDELIAQDLAAIGVEKTRMIAVDNGIDLKRFRPATTPEKNTLRRRFGLAHARYVVLVCGQLCHRKGTDLILEAWPLELAARLGITLAFAGAGPLQPSVAESARRHPGLIAYLGQLDDTAPATRMCDAALLVSHCESFGNVVVEALASGLPVMATRCGIVERLIRPGCNGWLISSLERESLHASLRNFLESRDSWRGYADQCRDSVSGFDFAKIAQTYLAIYEQLKVKAIR